MKIFVVANVNQQKEILSKNIKADATITFIKTFKDINDENYDAVFILDKEMNDESLKNFTTKPVFVNSVIETISEKNWPSNFNRISGWPGFLSRPVWEIASADKLVVTELFNKLEWKYFFVKDEPGLVAARVISMIINEAFYALEQNVSNKEEINLAMKLGTNYPYGPFEWQEKIGLENIYELLHKLSATDKRYLPAPLLQKKYSEFITV